MRSKRVVLAVLAALVAVTTLAAGIHFATRTPAVEGAVRVEWGGEAVSVPLSGLALGPVRGEMHTAKGETRQIDARGVLLAEVIRAAGQDPADWAGAEVTADDGYHARVTAGELLAPDRVYLILREEGGARQIVFGDENSKRNISNVVSVTLLGE